jgi:hypothetical protein
LSDTVKRGSAEMRYLLGDLSEDEKTRMEQAFFADNAKFEELELAEEDLIDAYVRDSLSPEERRQFQRRLLGSPRLVERVNFARVLAKKVDSSIEAEPVVSPPEPKPKRWWVGFFTQQPAFGSAFATAVVLLLFGGAILLYGWLQLRSQSAQLASERATLQQRKDELDKQTSEQRSQVEQLRAELQRTQTQQAEDQRRIKELELAQNTKVPDRTTTGTILSFILTTTALRSGSSDNQFKIDAHTSNVELTLPLETNEYSSYNVTIKNVDKGVPIQRSGLKPQRAKSGQQLVFRIPARPGDYTIEVSGRSPSGNLEPVSNFGFRLSLK